MKNLVVLNALNCRDYASEKNFDGKNAFELSLKWAVSLEFCEKVIVLLKNESQKSSFKEESFDESVCEFLVKNDLSDVQGLLKTMAEFSNGFDNVVYGFADCPFYNKDLTKKMFDLHIDSASEYTFADGYSFGFAPEILNVGTLNILSVLSQKDEKWQKTKIKTDSIFEILKTDINSFEIETYISDDDYRFPRFSFICSNKNNALLCKKLFDSCSDKDCLLWNVEKVNSFAVNQSDFYQNLPQYYNIQICSSCSGNCSFCPYPASFEKKFGVNPSKSESMMSLENFSSLIDKIAEFSGEAAVSLSLWGESILHPQLDLFVEKILSHPGLSVLIELSGRKFSESMIEKIKTVTESAKERTNDMKKIYWIVSLDSVDSATYDSLHNKGKSCDENSYENALHNLSVLNSKFAGSVYPQFLRLKENESSLESFWRSWNEKNGGNLIIKKYDWFSGLLEQKKTADLSPVKRNICWHLCRDFVVLFDGTVPLCQDYMFDNLQGNAFTESLESIWEKRRKCVKEHSEGTYQNICGKCDEYYIFNF
ncbi:MAG: spiro-SPASM protein [Treponemataceae bacterium]|nr:spiro-SPASM protein [Treponemataceae bacterium]